MKYALAFLLLLVTGFAAGEYKSYSIVASSIGESFVTESVVASPFPSAYEDTRFAEYEFSVISFSGKILHSGKTNFNVEAGHFASTSGEGKIYLTFSAPYFPDAERIDIRKEDRLVLSVDVTQFSECNSALNCFIYKNGLLLLVMGVILVIGIGGFAFHKLRATGGIIIPTKRR